MFFRKALYKKYDVNINFLFTIFLIWLPALVDLQRQTQPVTYIIAKFGFIISIFMILYIWISGLQTIKSPASKYTFFWAIPFLITGFLYFSKIFEYLCNLFFATKKVTIFITLIWLSMIIVVGFVLFKRERERLHKLYLLGYLKRYKILNLKNGNYEPTFTFPGIDGSSPDQMKIKENKLMLFLGMVPTGPITFFLLRTGSDLLGLVFVFIFVLASISFYYFGIRILASSFQIRSWEKLLKKRLFVNVQDE